MISVGLERVARSGRSAGRQPTAVRSAFPDASLTSIWAGSSGGLSLAERALLSRIARSPHQVEAGGVIVQVGERMSPQLLLSGWACRVRMTADGRRQILSLVLPFDEVSPILEPPNRFATYSVVAITTVQVSVASELQSRLLALDNQFARLHARCLAALNEELRRTVDHTVRLGRKTAYDRLGHFFLEVFYRLHAIGQVYGTSFRLPLTQEMIGDALGLSYVHVNRTLQEMRRNGVIATQNGWVTIEDPEMLAELTEFAVPSSDGSEKRHGYAWEGRPFYRAATSP